MKAAVRASSSADGEIERKDFSRKDLLSLMVRANMASDTPDSNRMTDEEVLSRALTMTLYLYITHALAFRNTNVPFCWA
jgi:cytochrome P450